MTTALGLAAMLDRRGPILLPIQKLMNRYQRRILNLTLTVNKLKKLGNTKIVENLLIRGNRLVPDKVYN